MIKNVLFDFDGVIIDSMPIKTEAFRKVFEGFEATAVEKLLDYHNLNGGLSRYVKIKYFFEDVLHTTIKDDEILNYAERFSQIIKKELTNKEHLIGEVVRFLKRNQEKYNFHIVSGADEKELRYLCNELGIADYFKSIHGSPVHKNDLVKQLLQREGYNVSETVLIGDSINDHEAALVNGIGFYAYNNLQLKELTDHYLDCIEDFIE